TEGDPWSSLSAGALEQVLDNLIANALEVAPPDTAVDLRAAREGEQIVVEVTDNGPGMAPEARAHAFDRFWRGGEGQRGSGLGLAIVKSLVEADGGTVRLQAPPDGGLRVVITLVAEVPAPRIVAEGQPKTLP
ncbi:MAG: sensor histidine kinase, partial [Thermoleophilia bacterium]|nr:sensor histidine kinase [Thermoleophilia bacterium]